MKVLAFTAALSVACPAFAGDLRCSGNIVSAGMTSARLLELCGEPALETYVESELKDAGEDGRETIRYEHATLRLYDPGRGSFLRVVRLEDDRVTSVSELRVRSGTSSDDCAANPQLLNGGDPAILLSYVCGQPAARQVLSDTYVPLQNGLGTKRRVRTEAWRYVESGRELRVEVSDGQISSSVVR